MPDAKRLDQLAIWKKMHHSTEHAVCKHDPSRIATVHERAFRLWTVKQPFECVSTGQLKNLQAKTAANGAKTLGEDTQRLCCHRIRKTFHSHSPKTYQRQASKAA